MAVNSQEIYRNHSEDKLKKLLNETLKSRLQPLDKYEIAAILESNGWTDRRVAAEFGAESVFDLAADLWDITQRNVVTAPIFVAPKAGFFATVFMVFRSFMRGLIFALPMAISVMAMLTLRLSLWSYEFLSLEIATSIAIGTIMSFMVVGGFTQAIARRGFLYIKQGYYNMARRITMYFVRLGYIVSFIVTAIYLIFNVFFGIFPFNMTLIIVLYFFFLSAIWLSVTIMYMLEKELAFTFLLMAGIFSVFVFFEILKIDIIVAQIISLFFVAVAGMLLALYFFKSAERKMEKGIAPALPRASITIYTCLPYFAYGFLYFTFLFVDRVVAWSTNNIWMPYLIWFRGQYELGLDLALLTMIFPMGFIEVVVTDLMTRLEIHQKDYLGRESHLLGKKYLRLYFARIYLVGLFSVLSAAMVYTAVRYVGFSGYLPSTAHLLYDKTTLLVFLCAMVAYVILCMALLNVLILFSLSQPEMAVEFFLKALALNIVVGFLCSRWFDYSLAVIGLLAGSIFLLVISTRQVSRVLKKLDYYLYASS